jgi:hypothetical protein
VGIVTTRTRIRHHLLKSSLVQEFIIMASYRVPSRFSPTHDGTQVSSPASSSSSVGDHDNNTDTEHFHIHTTTRSFSQHQDTASTSRWLSPGNGPLSDYDSDSSCSSSLGFFNDEIHTRLDRSLSPMVGPIRPSTLPPPLHMKSLTTPSVSSTPKGTPRVERGNSKLFLKGGIQCGS